MEMSNKERAFADIGTVNIAELENVGLTVVDMKRLEALERLYTVAMRWRNGMVDKAGFSNYRQAHQADVENRLATWELVTVIDALEAMERA